MLLKICHKCEHRQRPCAGACLCTIDNIDIRDHAGRRDCPKGKFPLADESEFPPLEEVKADINRGGCGCSPPKE